MKIHFTLFIITTLIASANLNAQDTDSNHQLLWRISSLENQQDSYIYGTMHLRDPRVFKFSDSLYVKIKECNYFALEVHPDTLIKHLIVDPFNSAINQSIEDSWDEDLEDFEDVKIEIKEKTGLDIGGISKDNLDLIPLLLDKMFKKNKDKNTFLDAHLYHIARILDKDIVGLETIEDHRMALRPTPGDSTKNYKKLIESRKSEVLLLEQMIDIYSAGDVNKIFEFGNYAQDSVLAFRNNVMVESSVQYIDSGGLFMAVGAAHLAGPRGMIQLLKEKGYTVQPVKAVFSKNLILSELADQKLDWVKEQHPLTGFSVSMPDHSYNYLPESMVGMVQVRSYPDLGLGHFFFYSAAPITVSDYTLEYLVKEMKARVKARGGTLSKKDIKKGDYQGVPMLEISYGYRGSKPKFRFFIKNNYIYTFGISKINNGSPDKELTSKFFNSIKFQQIEQQKNEIYLDSKAGYQIKTNLTPQTFSETDDSYGVKTLSDFTSFFDRKSKLMHIVVHSSYEAGQVVDDVDSVIDDFQTYFYDTRDSLVYAKRVDRYDGNEFLIEYEDGTFMSGFAFIRGNKMYQILSNGPLSPDNLNLATEFRNNFSLAEYASYSQVPFETDAFKTMLPSKPKIDTLEENYLLNVYSDKAIQYYSMDPNSGMNVLIIENFISPYATYESIDSCQQQFNQIYQNYNDTLISSIVTKSEKATYIDLQTRNQSNQLHYDMRLAMDGDRLYEIYVVQDTAAIDDTALEKFRDNFAIKSRSRTPSLLLRDSSTVRVNILSDLTSKDTSILRKVSNALNKHSFNQDEIALILKQYEADYSMELPNEYHYNMLDFLQENITEDDYSVYQKIYNLPNLSDQIRFKILELLLENKNEKSISMIQEFLNSHMPVPDSEYAVSSMFWGTYDSLELLKPIVPELINLSKTDSSIILSSLFYNMLDDDVILYEDLSSIHDFIDTIAQKKYQALKKGDQEEQWSLKSDLQDLSLLLSFSENKAKAIEYSQYFFQDSSYYYKFHGAEMLIRLNQDPDLSGVYQEFNEYAAKVEMYRLKSSFPEIEILPDSMLNMDKYIEIASMSYLEDEEYFSNSTYEMIDTYKENDKAHYFLKSSFDYDDEDVYEVIIHSVVTTDKNSDLMFPKYNDVYTYYLYTEEYENSESKTIAELRSYYNEFKNE